jgi:hypothetical protein
MFPLTTPMIWGAHTLVTGILTAALFAYPSITYAARSRDLSTIEHELRRAANDWSTVVAHLKHAQREFAA